MTKPTTEKPVVLVGGGTGGHIFPLIALGEELDAQNRLFIFVGEKGGREEAIVKELGWVWKPIAAGKWRRYLTPETIIANIGSVFQVFRGFFQSISFLSRTGATAVFSKGGYVALPMVYAARLLGRKVYVHESDAVMGLTNRLSANFAARVFTAFGVGVYPRHDNRYRQVGIPIRRALRQAAKLKAPQKNRPLILVMGGIQGASALNAYVRSNVQKLIKIANIVHVTGDREYENHLKVQKSLDKVEQPLYKPFAFLDRELPYYFQTADLIISRASATTIAEGALFGRAMFLVPLPTAASNHQVANARILEKNKAAVVYEEYQLSSERFFETVKNLLVNPEELQEMGANLKSYFYRDEAIKEIIDELTNG